MTQFLRDVVPVVLGIVIIFWLAVGVGLFIRNPSYLFKWNYDAAWILMFGVPSIFAFYISYRLKRRFSGQENLEDSLIIPKRVRERESEGFSLKISKIPTEEPEYSLLRDKNVIRTPEGLENRREDEFINDFFLNNDHLKQSKDLFKHISAYVRSYRQRAPERENLELFTRLLKTKDMMLGNTYQDIEDFVDVELQKVREEERQGLLKRGKNRRKGGYGGTERASTW